MIWKMTFGLHAIYWQEHQYKSLMLVQVSFYTCLHPSLKGSICFQHRLHPQLGEKSFSTYVEDLKLPPKFAYRQSGKWQK